MLRATLRIPETAARAFAWLAVIWGVLITGEIGPDSLLHPHRSSPEEAWLLLLGISNVVIGAVVASRRMQARVILLRLIGAAFPLLWGAALILVGALLDEPVWQFWVRIVGGSALLILSAAIACMANWALKLASFIAWCQVLFQFGTTIALLTCDLPLPRTREPVFVSTILQVLSFLLLVRVFSRLDSAQRSPLPIARSTWPQGVALLAALIGLCAGWALEWAGAPWVPAAGCAFGAVLGASWWTASTANRAVRFDSHCISIPRIRLTTAAGRMASGLLAVVGATIVIVPLAGMLRTAVFIGFPLALGILSPLLGIVLAVGLAREYSRSLKQSVMADHSGFSIMTSGQTRYVPYVECAWGEIRRTIWGAELVVRTSGFHQIVAYPLLDDAAVLAAARVLRRSQNVRAKGVRHANQFIARPHGASLRVWIRGIQDLVRGGPYDGRAPAADALYRVLGDVRCPADERAGAAVALVALRQELQLDAGYPPLVRVAAALAGAGHSIQEAVAYLDDNDRVEVQQVAAR